MMSDVETPSDDAGTGDRVSEDRRWLLPEFHVLRDRLGSWKRRLSWLESQWEASPEIGDSLQHEAQTLQRIGSFLDQQLAIFFETDRPAADPETLRRLLIHGEESTRRCGAHFAAMESAESVIGPMIDLLRDLLLRPSADSRSLFDSIDRLQAGSDLRRDCWTFLGRGSTRLLLERFQAGTTTLIPMRCRETLPEILNTGIASAQIAMQIAEPMSLSSDERRAVLSACLLQDIGFLLLERRFRCPPSELCRIDPEECARHPRFSAALAEGITGLSVDMLRAIGRHHERFSTRKKSQLSDVTDIVAVISRFTELFAELEQSIDSADRIGIAARKLESESRLGDWPGEVVAALQSTLETCIAPFAIDGEMQSDNLPAPHFLRKSPTSAIPSPFPHRQDHSQDLPTPR